MAPTPKKWTTTTIIEPRTPIGVAMAQCFNVTSPLFPVAWVFAGLNVENYGTRPDDFARAIAACKATTQGVMIFDAVHVDQRSWWDVLERALASDAKAPDRVPGLLQAVRATAAALKSGRGNGGVTLGEVQPVPISQTP